MRLCQWLLRIAASAMPLAYHAAKHAARLRAQRHAECPDLARASCHFIGEQPIQADARQQQCTKPKRLEAARSASL